MPHIQFTKLCRHCAEPSVYVLLGRRIRLLSALFFSFPFSSASSSFFFLLFCGSVWRAYNANIYLQERACVFADKRQSLIHMHGGLKMHLSDHMVVFCSAPAARIRVEPNSVTLRIRDAPALRMFTALPLPSAPTFYTHPYSPPFCPPPPPPPFHPVYLLLPFFKSHFFLVYVMPMCICRYFKDVVRFCLTYH